MKKSWIAHCPKTKEILLGKSKRNLIFFGLIFVPNFLAALLEGISFSFILLALTALSQGVAMDPTTYPAPFRCIFGGWLQGMSQQKLFILFMSFAIGLQIVKSILSYLGQVATAVLGMRVQIEAQSRIYKQILRFSFPYVSHYKAGDLVEHVNAPGNFIHQLTNACNVILTSALTVVVSLVMMLLLSPSLTFLALIIFGGVAVIQKFIIRKVSAISIALSNHMTDFSKHTTQSLHALRVIHTFDRKESILQHIYLVLKDVSSSLKKLNLWNSATVPINEIIAISSTGIFLISGQFMLKGTHDESLPILMTFVMIAYRLSGRFQGILSSTGAIAFYWGKIIRMEEILAEQGKEFAIQGSKKIDSFRSEIIFNNVSLNYSGSTRDALKEISFTIPKGGSIAFVGHSGSGKSSVIDLISRLYLPTRGEILIDGVDLKELDISNWRALLGVVSQDTFIFNETVEENIRFGELNATPEMIREASEIAGAHEFILALPRSYQTILGERGFRLSGGERQRISLARALVRNPEILILDEATSNLDNYSERLIQEMIDKFHKNKTVIVVAHRLSTVTKADKIFVLDKGKLVEQGGHEELLKKGGVYAKLCHLAMQKSH